MNIKIEMKKMIMKRVSVLYILGIIIYCAFIFSTMHISAEESGNIGIDSEMYTIEYYTDNNGMECLPLSVNASIDFKTPLFTAEELGIDNGQNIFEGWCVNRSIDGKWLIKNVNMEISWEDVPNGMLPEGYSYFLVQGESTFNYAIPDCVMRLVAKWGGVQFEVHYHLDENSESDHQISYIEYGQSTPMLSIDNLGFFKEGKKFAGWKIFREIDGKWRVLDSEQNATWIEIKDGILPDGYQFFLYSDVHELSKAATSGVVHAYAQWMDD